MINSSNERKKVKFNSYTFLLFAKLGGIVFCTELVIMFVLNFLDIHGAVETIIDLSALTIVSSLLFYFSGLVGTINTTKKELGAFTEIVSGMQNVVIVSITDLSGKIIYANQLFSDISGYSKEELIGQDHRIVNSGYHPKEFFTEMWQTISAGKIWQGEVKNKNKMGGYYWVFSSVIPLRKNNSNEIEKYISIRFDITKKKEQEISLAEANQYKELAEKQMYHTEKLATLGHLSSGVAHEINNPLLIIKGNANFVLKSLKKNICGEEEIDSIEKQLKAIVRISKIVTGLRTYSRKDTDEVQPIDINQAIVEIYEMTKQLYSHKGIKIELSLTPDKVFVLGNLGKLEQIIMNLVTNACDASLGRPSALIKIESEVTNQKALIRVKDFGTGISKENLAHIFDPFFTTKEPGKGTGLGLAISSKLMIAMNGTIDVESTEGVGTTFTLTLKLAIQ